MCIYCEKSDQDKICTQCWKIPSEQVLKNVFVIDKPLIKSIIWYYELILIYLINVHSWTSYLSILISEMEF